MQKKKKKNRIHSIGSNSDNLIISIIPRISFSFFFVLGLLICSILLRATFRDVINEWPNLTDPSVLIFLVVGSIGNIAVSIIIFWSLFGKEDIIVNKKHLQINKTIFSLGRKKKYPIEKVSHICYKKDFDFDLLGRVDTLFSDEINTGSIWFKYESMIIKIADGINNDEASKIIQNLKSSKYLENEKFEIFDLLKI